MRVSAITRKVCVGIIGTVFVSGALSISMASSPSSELVYIGAPSFYAEMDAGGYSDWMHWGSSARHDVPDCATMTSFPMEEQRGMDETYEMMMMSSGSSAYGLHAAQAEPTLKEQIDNAQYIIDWLERLWKQDNDLRKEIDEKDWDAFIDKVYEWFYSLEDLYEELQSNIGSQLEPPAGVP